MKKFYISRNCNQFLLSLTARSLVLTSLYLYRFLEIISLNLLDKNYKKVYNNIFIINIEVPALHRISKYRALQRRRWQRRRRLCATRSVVWQLDHGGVRGTCVRLYPFAPRFLISHWLRSSIVVRPVRRRALERRGSNERQWEATKKPLPRSLTTTMSATPRRGYASARRHSRWCIVSAQRDQLWCA